MPESKKVSKKQEVDLNAAIVKSNAVNNAAAEVVISDSGQKVGPRDKAFWEYKFEITMPNSLLNFLRLQEEVLSESSNESLLLPLPWQSKMATAAKILELFLSNFGDDESCQKRQSTELQNFPSYEALKVSRMY